jgi:antitoxin PrlF
LTISILFPYCKVRILFYERIIEMPVSTLTVKGQTTIPKKIRAHLKLQPGDKIDFIIEDEGKVVLEPATLDIRELEGILHKPGIKTVSVEEMKKTIKRRFKRKHLHIK